MDGLLGVNIPPILGLSGANIRVFEFWQKSKDSQNSKAYLGLILTHFFPKTADFFPKNGALSSCKKS